MNISSINNSKRYHLYIILLVLGFITLYFLFTSILFPSEFRKYVVYAQIGSFSPYFFSIAVVITIFGIMILYRSIKYELTSLFFIILTLFTSALSYFFGWLNWNPLGEKPLTALYEAQLLFSTISLFFLFLHFELNERESPRAWLTSFISISLFPLSFKNIFSIFTGIYQINPTFEYFLGSLVQVGGIVIFIANFVIGLKISNAIFSQNKQARNLGGIQFAGLLLLFFHVLFEFTEGLFKIVNPRFSVFNTPILVIAVLLISVPYYKNPQLLSFVSPNVKAVGIVDVNGITHYFRATSVEFEERRAVSEELFGGLTVAFQSVGKEVAQAKKGVDSLKFGDRAIIIEANHPFYFVVIAEKSSYFLHLEMKEYLRELKAHYSEPPQYGEVISEDLIKELNEKFFPMHTPYYFTTESESTTENQ
ncbi:MAG: membrane protein of unknown function [Promethearchaeota archaeon]|nr:MAG: membrane protein of unknown function [Candidatus Lokiarchaeota archaeon]